MTIKLKTLRRLMCSNFKKHLKTMSSKLKKLRLLMCSKIYKFSMNLKQKVFKLLKTLYGFACKWYFSSEHLLHTVVIKLQSYSQKGYDYLVAKPFLKSKPFVYVSLNWNRLTVLWLKTPFILRYVAKSVLIYTCSLVLLGYAHAGHFFHPLSVTFFNPLFLLGFSLTYMFRLWPAMFIEKLIRTPYGISELSVLFEVIKADFESNTFEWCCIAVLWLLSITMFFNLTYKVVRTLVAKNQTYANRLWSFLILFGILAYLANVINTHMPKNPPANEAGLNFGHAFPCKFYGEGTSDFNNPLVTPEVIGLHFDVMCICLFIAAFVFYVLIATLRRAPGESDKVHHDSWIEIVWTIVPALIITLIAIPSVTLLDSLDEIVQPSLTVKDINNPWYWAVDYGDYASESDLVGNGLTFDSNLLQDDDSVAPPRVCLASPNESKNETSFVGELKPKQTSIWSRAASSIIGRSQETEYTVYPHTDSHTAHQKVAINEQLMQKGISQKEADCAKALNEYEQTRKNETPLDYQRQMEHIRQQCLGGKNIVDRGVSANHNVRASVVHSGGGSAVPKAQLGTYTDHLVHKAGEGIASGAEKATYKAVTKASEIATERTFNPSNSSSATDAKQVPVDVNQNPAASKPLPELRIVKSQNPVSNESSPESPSGSTHNLFN